MDKLQLTQVAPILWVLAIVIMYYLIVKNKPTDEREVLFHEIMEKGCGNCGGDFQIIYAEITRTSDMLVECKFCMRRYKIDHTLQYAWRLER